MRPGMREVIARDLEEALAEGIVVGHPRSPLLDDDVLEEHRVDFCRIYSNVYPL